MQRGLGVVLVAALCLTVAMPSAMAARYSLIQRDLINSLFTGNDATAPVPIASQPKVAAADPWANVGRVNMLLIGSDYAPHSDRIGVRTDSIVVASIDTKTGNTVLFGLPRNLEKVPFPASDPLSKVWPNGFNCGGVCLLNAVWQQGEINKNLFPNGGRDAGIIATRDAVSEVLGPQARLLHRHRPDRLPGPGQRDGRGLRQRQREAPDRRQPRRRAATC